MTEKVMISSIGEGIKLLRKQYYPNDDQKTFSFRVNVSRATYQKIEKGDLSVSMSSYYSVAKFLGIEDRFHDLFNQKKEPVNLIKELDL